MKIILALLAIMLLAACSQPVPVVIQEKPQLVFPPAPEPVSVPVIHWSVIKVQDTTYYALTYEELEKLLMTMNDVKVWIQKKNAETEFYKKSLDSPPEAK